MIITVIGVIAITITALWLYRPPTTTEHTDSETPSNGLLFIPEGLHETGRHEATPENSEYHAERLIERFTEQLDTERVLREWMERSFREPAVELIDYGMGVRR